MLSYVLTDIQCPLEYMHLRTVCCFCRNQFSCINCSYSSLCLVAVPKCDYGAQVGLNMNISKVTVNEFNVYHSVLNFSHYFYSSLPDGKVN